MADAQSIFKSKFKDYSTFLRDVSFDKDKNEYLCQDAIQEVYDFDKITKDMYPSKQPSSYDALLLQKDKIYCIEFKNERYADINRKIIVKKLQNGREVLNQILSENNIPKSDYSFIFCVAYKDTETRWRRAIEKNEVQFELEEYKGKYFDEIYTNDIQFFTHEYKKHFKKELAC